MDLDAGITDRTDGNRQGDPLEKRKIDVDIEALSLEARETIGNGLESFANGPQVIESLLQTEVAQIVGTEFVAQVAGELFVLFEKGVLPVGAEYVVAVFRSGR